jgi:hypothetical protein
VASKREQTLLELFGVANGAQQDGDFCMQTPVSQRSVVHKHVRQVRTQGGWFDGAAWGAKRSFVRVRRRD